jgi:hypothetical protein
LSTLQAIFTNIYETNGFGGDESKSGGGSSLAATKVLRGLLPGLFMSRGIISILDAPCGDMNWMKTVDLTGIRYIGADIVEEIITRNRDQHRDKEFELLNLISDPLPKVDLIICRDCLVHLPTVDAMSALDNFKNSGSKYLLATTFPLHNENPDVFTGAWRPLNLATHPFDLGEPIEVLNEGYTDDYGLFVDKSMGMWRLNV